MRVADIKIEGRRRELDEEQVRPLADSIELLGLINPLLVRKSGELVAGLHRLEAVKLLGWDDVDVRYVEEIDPVQTGLLEVSTGERALLLRDLAEIDENLVRVELSVLGKSEHLLARKTIYERLHPETVNGVRGARARWSDDANDIMSFASDTAEKTGYTKRAVQRSVRIARDISEEVKDKIRGTDLADRKVDLIALSRMDEDIQEQVVDAVQSGEAKSVKAAAAMVKRKRKTASIIERAAPTGQDIRVERMDALELIGSLDDGSVSALITDPPYNVTDYEWDSFRDIEDFVEWTRSWLVAARSKLAERYHAAVFCDARFSPVMYGLLLEAGYQIQRQCIWHRPNLAKKRSGSRTFLSSYEPFWHCGNTDLYLPEQWGAERFDVQSFAAPQSNHTKDPSYHPCQKPIGLIEQLVKVMSPPGSLVLDPYLGSGTTALACQMHGRRFVGCDLDEEHIKITQGRLADG